MQKSRFHVLASFAALTVVSVSSSSAHAASSTTCTGSSVVTYSPGLTTTTQTVTYGITDTYSSCTSTDSSLTAGGFSLSNLSSRWSCDSASGAGLGQQISYTISWNNGQTSTVSLTLTDAVVLGTEQVTGVGTITSGEFAGDDITVVVVYPTLDPLLCLTSGVTSESGTEILEIVGT